MSHFRDLTLWAVSMLLSFSALSQCYDSWQYAVPLAVDNSAGVTKLDYQVRFLVQTNTLVASGKMQNAGEDMRFGSSCCQPFCYWIESGMNTDSTWVWVKFDSIAGNQTSDVFMFYGNPSANDAQDPWCTFVFYEDFEDTATSNQWTQGNLPDPNSFYSNLAGSNWITTDTVEGTTQAPLGSQTFGVINNGILSYEHSYIESPMFPSALGDTSLRVIVDSYTANESGCPGFFDVEWFEVSYDTGSTWVNLNTCTDDMGFDYLHRYGDNQWRTFSYDSIGLANLFRCRMNTGDDFSGPPDQVGWYVDNIRFFKDYGDTMGLAFGQEITKGTVTTPNDTLVCDGDNATLTATGGTLYIWNSVDTMASITVTPTTGSEWHFIQVSDSMGCTHFDSVQVGVSPQLDLGADTTLCDTITLSIVLDAGPGMSSYLWNDMNTNRFKLVTTPGTYYVDVVDAYGCTGTDTITINQVVCTGVLQQSELHGISVFPNPTTNTLFVEVQNSDVLRASLIDVTGQSVHNTTLTGAARHEFSVAKLPRGAYFLRLASNDQVTVFRVILQ